MVKFNDLLKKVYGILMTASFFGGILPLIAFIIALVIGGAAGESIAVFLYKKFYPWVIAFGSVAVLVGLVQVYVDKLIAAREKKAAE